MSPCRSDRPVAPTSVTTPDVKFTVISESAVELSWRAYSTSPLANASPSSFPQLQWVSTGAFFAPLDPKADKVFYQAVENNDDEEAMELYGQAADMYRQLNVFVPIANTNAVPVARAGISNIGVERQGLWTVDLADLRNTSEE